MLHLAGLAYLSDLPDTDGGREGEEKVREKVSSMNLLQQCYQTLTDKKIKDNLSSFLPEVPGTYTHTHTHSILSLALSLSLSLPLGEFDTADTPDSM